MHRRDEQTEGLGRSQPKPGAHSVAAPHAHAASVEAAARRSCLARVPTRRLEPRLTRRAREEEAAARRGARSGRGGGARPRGMRV